MDVGMHCHGEDRLRIRADIQEPHESRDKPYSRVTIAGASGDVLTLYGFPVDDLRAAAERLVTHVAELEMRLLLEEGQAAKDGATHDEREVVTAEAGGG